MRRPDWPPYPDTLATIIPILGRSFWRCLDVRDFFVLSWTSEALREQVFHVAPYIFRQICLDVKILEGAAPKQTVEMKLNLVQKKEELCVEIVSSGSVADSLQTLACSFLGARFRLHSTLSLSSTITATPAEVMLLLQTDQLVGFKNVNQFFSLFPSLELADIVLFIGVPGCEINASARELVKRGKRVAMCKFVQKETKSERICLESEITPEELELLRNSRKFQRLTANLHNHKIVDFFWAFDSTESMLLRATCMDVIAYPLRLWLEGDEPRTADFLVVSSALSHPTVTQMLPSPVYESGRLAELAKDLIFGHEECFRRVDERENFFFLQLKRSNSQVILTDTPVSGLFGESTRAISLHIQRIQD